MKNILAVLIMLVLASCGDNTSEQSVENVIASGSIDEMEAKKTALKDEVSLLNEQIATLNSAIQQKNPRDSKPVLITTKMVKDTIFNHYVEVQGNVETKKNVLVYPEYQGTLSRVYVKEGQRVSKGQTLARIDDGGLSSQVSQAEAQAALAKTTFERQQRLWEQKIGSEIQYLQAKTQYESAQSLLRQAKSQLGKTTVSAPFSGVIDEVVTDQGTVVAPGVALFRIVNLDDMYVTADIPESYLPTVTKGKKVMVAFPVLGESVEATVRQTGNYINPANRSFTVEVDVPNKNGRIKPNLTARLSINDYTSENAILVPLNVINENADGEQYVYIASAKANENKMVAQQKIITTGKSQGDRIEILSGINAGDKIIVEGARSVKDNQEVKILTY
ncbi:efflux RND transporter periplasmic adaptor subunit [Dokdonia sp. Hel_I_53]|uniref:efflux RND transporter periplasmic adaptor subunit n=1 Tax=Dokdonia sp. Hel_I_53 TaxID=1566287 RepID=UPI00119ABFC1|nr:efflux RND transporter periplasmic adaptor subunit [Dokdonia sp. Hel_I_53]TVZ52957.1 RND family efflux transporter MFP subunit [Dokdonia sp. Hel_I_53]